LTAHFEESPYTIALESYPYGAGDVNGGGTFPYGTPITIEADPHPNYVFEKWTEGDSMISANPVHYPYVVTHTCTLTAHFLPKRYEITIESRPPAGGKTTGAGYYDFNQLVNAEATANPNYVFSHWSEDEDTVFKCYTLLYSFPALRDRNLVANFTLKTFNVTVTASPKEGGTVEENKYNIPYGTQDTVRAYHKPHYQFDGWWEDTLVCGEWEYPFTVTADRNLVARFKSETYHIKLIANPNTGGVLEGEGDYYYNVDTVVKANANVGYAFVSWEDEEGAVVWTNENYPITVTQDRTFTANFEERYVDVFLVADPEAGGTVEGGGTGIPCNQIIPIKAEAKPNYNFVNWTEDGVEVSTNAIENYRASHNCTLTANFKPDNFTITVEARPKHCGTATGGGNYDFGEPATVTAAPHEDYRFVNWTEDGEEVSTEAIYTFIVERSRHLVANFDTLSYLVTVSVNNSDLGNAFETKRYYKNQRATVKAVPKIGYRFENWTREEDGVIISRDMQYSFTVTSDTNLVANFLVLEFDEYAATLWDNTFMLNLKKFDDEGFGVIGCKWFKNNKQEMETNTIDEYSYSAGPKITDLLEKAPTEYMFQVNTTAHGWLFSTKKVIDDYDFPHAPVKPNGLTVYPNPAVTGVAFTVEGAKAGATLMVYNQFGVCVGSAIAQEDATTLSLNLPTGIYLIRAEEKEAKIVVVNR
jgi:uncharacterized repeat protein (TIGR02543 family)